MESRTRFPKSLSFKNIMFFPSIKIQQNKKSYTYNIKTYRVKPELYDWCMIKGIKLSCDWKLF
jgi:hypothetical protein